MLIGALLWLPYAVFGARTSTLRAGIATLLRLGVLTLLMSLWWLIAYAVGNARGLPILAITENINTTNGPTSATEVLRGLGYWLFYGRVGGSPGLPDIAAPYVTVRLLARVVRGAGARAAARRAGEVGAPRVLRRA